MTQKTKLLRESYSGEHFEIERLKKLTLSQIQALPEEKRRLAWRGLAQELGVFVESLEVKDGEISLYAVEDKANDN